MELNVHLFEYWMDDILKFVYLKEKSNETKGNMIPLVKNVLNV
jgi:hypothetical protein